MSSPGWLIGVFMLFLSCIIIGNVFSEIDQPLAASDVSNFAEGGSSVITEAPQGQSGGMASFINTTKTVWRFVWRSLTADYAFFYNYDPITNTRTPNEYFIFRYYFLCIQYGILITLAIVAFRYV